MKLFTFITFILSTFSAFTFSQEVNLLENSRLVKAGDKYVTLLGQQINVGDTAPSFKVVNDSFSPVSFDSFVGKNIIISVEPSLDTGLCPPQAKAFNEKASKLPQNTVFIVISNDLPFASKRFCTTENINNIHVLSDSVWRDFGTKYGLLIKDMGLLTRAILVVNSEQKLVYKDLVANLSDLPDYETALQKVTQLTSQTPE